VDYPFRPVVQNWPALVDGLFVTLQIAAASLVLSLLLGLVLVGVRMLFPTVGRWLVTGYVEVIRNVPPLVLLYFIFFALPHAGLVLDPFTSGVLGLTIYHAAFVAEVLRAGVEAVGSSQLEAARSLGLNAAQALRYVVLPQAAVVVLPPLGNLAISLTKTTSLVAIISVSDITYQSQILVSDTFRPFELFAAAGAVYLCLSLGIGQITRAAEKRLTAYRFVRA